MSFLLIELVQTSKILGSLKTILNIFSFQELSSKHNFCLKLKIIFVRLVVHWQRKQVISFEVNSRTSKQNSRKEKEKPVLHLSISTKYKRIKMYFLPFLNPLIRDILNCVFVDSFSVELKTQCCRDLFVSGVRRHRNPISFPFQVFNNALDGKTNRQTDRQSKERKLFDRCNAFYWKWSKRCLGQTICVVLCAYRNRKSKRRNKSKSKARRRGLVVRIEDSRPRGRGFESRPHCIDHLLCTINLDQKHNC